MVSVGAVALGLGSPARAAPTPPPAQIIGGTPTTVGQYPTVVALQIGRYLCTGTLVGPTWVLTSAACIDPAFLVLSSQDQVTANTEVHLKTVDLSNDIGDVVKAIATFKDPLFNKDALGSHDLGLIQLAAPVTDITPSPININAAAAQVGTIVTMVGYGATAPNQPTSAGVEHELRDQASVSCSSLNLGIGADTDLLCFSKNDQHGTCGGDAGGPAFAMVAGRQTVIGVDSFGDSACVTYNAQTRVDVERAFLMTHIPELLGCLGDQDCSRDRICFSQTCIAEPFGPRGLGTMCNTAADCDSSMCVARSPDDKRCSLPCSPSDANACPDGFECVRSGSASDGACWPEAAGGDGLGGGCCEVGGEGGSGAAVLGLGVIALARRRRRSETRSSPGGRRIPSAPRHRI